MGEGEEREPKDGGMGKEVARGGTKERTGRNEGTGHGLCS